MTDNPVEALIAGGGIGGLACALACARSGVRVRLYEQAAAFGEVGAGVQLGPNAVRVLQGWGLAPGLDAVAARHVGDLPTPVRTMLGALGVTSNMADVRGAALASYLLFEAGYTQELMALGRADTLAMRGDVCQFFGWTDGGQK